MSTLNLDRLFSVCVRVCVFVADLFPESAVWFHLHVFLNVFKDGDQLAELTWHDVVEPLLFF